MIEDLYYENGKYKGKMRGKYADLRKSLDKNLELAKIYPKYQEALTESKVYDYDDMVLQVAQALSKNPGLLLRLQEKFQYFLVDEHQDTNNAQNKVLELLSNFYEQPNLFVVGDEKQAIFRFQGASLDNFLYFKKLYPKAKLISLNKNYRSTQPILDAAQCLIQNNRQKISLAIAGIDDSLVSCAGVSDLRDGNPLSKPSSGRDQSLLGLSKRDWKPSGLVSGSGFEGGLPSTDGKIHICEFKRPETENYFIAEKIKELLKTGVSAKEIAIIYRDNKDASAVADALNRYNLPFRVESANNVLEDEDIGQFLDILKFINNPANEEKLFPILCSSYSNIPALDIYKLTSPNVRKSPLLELMADEKRLQEIKIASYAGVKNLADNLLNWHKFARYSALVEVFEKILHGGFLRLILVGSDSASKLSKFNALFNEAKKITLSRPNAKLSDFINYLSILEKYNVGIKSSGFNYIPEAVRLMTAHGAKGLEFDYVFVVNAYDGHWGNRRIPQLIKLPRLVSISEGRTNMSLLQFGGDKSDAKKKHILESKNSDLSDLKTDDERRLFYVALTRARKMAYVTYALQRPDGREATASQFITEIKPELAEKISTDVYEDELAQKNSLLFQPKTSQGFSVYEKEYLRELFRKSGLSATAVNNFLTCPWKYFYLNLLRIPRAKSRHQIYGSAVHAGLKDFFDGMNGGRVSLEILLAGFKNLLEKESLSENDRQSFLAKGINSLKKYFDYNNGKWPAKTLNEFKVHNVFLNDNIKLTGSLDKIEYSDSDNSSVNVVDYKTGKAVSRNELDGKTKNATGNYKRQLVFYKLLLDRHPTVKLNMVSGEIDFIEPDSKGVFHKERFLIDTNEVDELKHTILTIADKVTNFKFENERCGDRHCEYCQLRFKVI